MVKPFLHQIALKILDKQQSDKLTIVLPSKRSIVFLKHYLSQELDQAIWLPKMYAIEDFITKLSSLKVLDNLSLQFRLYTIFDSHRPPENKDTFDQFLKWSQTVLYDFNEIDRYMVDAKHLLTNLRDIKELEQWSLNSADLTSFQEQYVNFFNHLHEWYKAFNESLENDGVAYQGMAYRKAAESILNSSYDFEEVWFVGLNALTTAENIIVNHFITYHNALLFWDADSFYMNNEQHEAGLFLRKHAQQFGSFKTTDFLSSKKHIEVIGCAKNIGQTKTAGHILNALETNQETALVLADENLLFPVLNNLPQSIESVNITMGSPLNSTTLFSLFDLLFQIHLRKSQYGQDKFHANDLLKLFRQPYLTHVLSTAFIDTVVRFLNKEKVIFVSSSQLKNTFSTEWDILHSFFSDWSDSSQVIHSIKSIIELLKDNLVQQKASVESEIIFSFYKSIQILENQLYEFDLEIDLKTLKSVFFQIIGKETISFVGEPLNGLQMMGVLETRTLDFKNLIILSVNEDKLPSGKSVNSFIPFVLKKHFNMPTHEERDAVYAYHFYRLLQRAEQVFLLYNTQNDDFGSGEKSRFITQLFNEYSANPIHEKILHADVTSISELQGLNITKTDKISQLIIDWASNKVSPTALTTYVNCKLQFYFKYIAKLHPKEDVVEFIEAHSFGSIIHDALFQAFLPHLEFNLTHDRLDEVKKETLQLISDGFDKEIGTRKHHGKNHLVWQVANKLIRNLFEKEKEYIEEINTFHKVIEVERTLTQTLQVNSIDVQLYGNVDRVDVTGDFIRIVDYKTGKVEQSDLSYSDLSELITNPKKSKAFQLLTYAYLYAKTSKSNKPLTAGNYSLRNLSDGVVYIKKSRAKDALSIDQSLINQFENLLGEVLNSILDKQSTFHRTDDLESCRYCDFRTVCGR
ncbi:MAG: PD-(D/E)XK nuclease family protein [Flavobacteriales bacterium]